MDIINAVEIYIEDKCNEYKMASEDNYDFWNEHIKLVYEESLNLAKKYDADIEIVALGALLHDIALICRVGERKDHHINGKILANEILEKYNYPTQKKEKVLNCVYNHRSSKNAQTIEELCVADADILAHFDNIPMLFNSAFNRNNLNLNEVRMWLKECFEKDYEDLSDKTKEIFKDRYKMICEIVLNEK
ncbi:MAG: HD domain-containing protein [Clostridia bacterium]|nr:HD domain-containing protein [Clostridia bacterium]